MCFVLWKLFKTYLTIRLGGWLVAMPANKSFTFSTMSGIAMSTDYALDGRSCLGVILYFMHVILFELMPILNLAWLLASTRHVLWLSHFATIRYSVCPFLQRKKPQHFIMLWDGLFGVYTVLENKKSLESFLLFWFFRFFCGIHVIRWFLVTRARFQFCNYFF